MFLGGDKLNKSVTQYLAPFASTVFTITQPLFYLKKTGKQVSRNKTMLANNNNA